MSDFFGDLYPIPVEFNDGQQPTAAFLNAWAAQIDTAFMLLGRIIGDYDGAGEAPDAYVTNVIRTFGVMGWVTSGLPRGLLTPDATGAGFGHNIPIIKEDLATYAGAKLALLTWRPDPTFGGNATEAEILALNVAITGEEANLGTAVAKGVTVTTSTLDSADKYLLDGRRLLTSDVLPVDAQYIYPIDTSDDTFYDAAGQGTGANLVPNMYEIYADPAIALCTIVPLGGSVYRLDFPDVRYIASLAKPQSVADADVTKLNGGGVLEWYSTAPKWNVPQHLLDLADLPDANDTVPGGMCALFVKNGDVVSRVRSSTTEAILWQRVDGSSTSIQITISAGVTLPHIATPALATKYIVAFAGTSVAEALLQERGTQRRHAHDGYGDGKLISAFKLADAFDPAKWNHPEVGHNHFPQYLERGGFNADDLNRNNAILGDLHIATVGALPSTSTDPESVAADSHKLTFGDNTNGPQFFFDIDDLAGKLGDHDKKLRLANSSLRIDSGGLFVGLFADSLGLEFETQGLGNVLELTAYSGDLEDGPSIFEASILNASSGKILFEDDAILSVGNTATLSFSTAPGDYPYQWSLTGNGTHVAETELVVGRVQAKYIKSGTAIPLKVFVGAQEFEPWRETFGGRFGPGTFDDPDASDGYTHAFNGQGTQIEGMPVNEGQLRLYVGLPGAVPVAGNEPTVPYWHIDGGADPNNTKLLQVKLTVPHSKSRQAAEALGDADLSATAISGAEVYFHIENDPPARAHDTMHVRIVAIKMRDGSDWDHSGDTAGGRYTTICSDTEEDNDLFGAGPFPGYFSWDCDGGADLPVDLDSDFEYYLQIFFDGVTECNFIGAEILYSTQYVS